jgi:peptidoglycan/xylan/chitin deacetylase (PgdA/CDA1 family)
MLKKVKRGVLASARSVGLFGLLGGSSWRRSRLLILGYHGASIEDEHIWNPELFMPPEMLRRRFEIIKAKGCTVLPLNEAVQRLYEQSLPTRAVAITFDDGFYNFYKEVLPIVQDLDIPVTLYATTFYSEFNRPIFGIAADYLLWKAGAQRLNLKRLIEVDEVVDLSITRARRRAHTLVVDYSLRNNFSAQRKDEMLRDLCLELDIDYRAFCRSRLFQLMTVDEISETAMSGVDVQLHTHRHRVPMDEALFAREINDNRKIIETATSAATGHFCYPSGQYHPSFFPWLERANVVSATTCEPALSEWGTHRFLLPRLIDTCNLSEVEFEGWLEGVSHFLPQRHYS